MKNSRRIDRKGETPTNKHVESSKSIVLWGLNLFTRVTFLHKWRGGKSGNNDPSFYKSANCNTLHISFGPFLGKGSAGVAFQHFLRY